VRYKRQSMHQQRHPEDILADRCGDALAIDLGLMIDIILEEHGNSLRSIINNIEHTRPGLAHLHGISERRVQCCEVDGICPISCRSHQISYSYYSPRAAEKLNVGSPGQLKPTVHDSHSSLRETVQTIPDLIDLLNSAADDFGIDLDRRPTARDDLIFQDAPVASTHRAPMSHEYEDSMHDIEETFADEQQLNEDPWVHQPHRSLSELAEARTHMVEQSDAVVGAYSEEHQNSHSSHCSVDSLSTGVSESSTGHQSKPTRFRNKSFDLVVEEITTMRTQGLQGLEEVLPNRIPNLFESAPIESPAAIESFTTFLQSRPGSVYGSSTEVSGAQSGQSNGQRSHFIQVYDEQRLSEPAYYEHPSSEPSYDISYF
jgi:hypothetical protein